MRCFKDESLFFVSESTFQFFIEMEKVFRLYYKQLCMLPVNIQEFFTNKFNNIPFDLPSCHNLKPKIITKFLSFRLKKMSMLHEQKLNSEHVYASKSVCMHAKVK